MKLPSFTPKQLIGALRRVGFVIDHQSGSHVIMRHPDGRRAVVAVHSRELKRGTLYGIVKQAGYTPEEFLRILK